MQHGGGIIPPNFSTWVKANGFDRVPAPTRSVAIELYENADAIEEWRDSLPERRRKRLIHPLSNCGHGGNHVVWPHHLRTNIPAISGVTPWSTGEAFAPASKRCRPTKLPLSGAPCRSRSRRSGSRRGAAARS